MPQTDHNLSTFGHKKYSLSHLFGSLAWWLLVGFVECLHWTMVIAECWFRCAVKKKIFLTCQWKWNRTHQSHTVYKHLVIQKLCAASLSTTAKSAVASRKLRNGERLKHHNYTFHLYYGYLSVCLSVCMVIDILYTCRSYWASGSKFLVRFNVILIHVSVYVNFSKDLRDIRSSCPSRNGSRR